MLRVFQTFIVWAIAPLSVCAQHNSAPSFNLGDHAPPVAVSSWIKGGPIDTLEKGKIYVIEFWATWCKPCLAGMPKLSALADKYRSSVTIIAIDVHENEKMSIESIKTFVDEMGSKMNFAVAVDKEKAMVTNWLESLVGGKQGIPATYVVNSEGRIAWVGHPTNLDSVLDKVVQNTWDVQSALNKRNTDIYLRNLDDSLNYELLRFTDVSDTNHTRFGDPDSTLIMINAYVKSEPELKYAFYVACQTFSALLRSNQREAYNYGKMVMTTSPYDEPAYRAIINGIEIYSDKLNINPELYELGAEAYQAEINTLAYPELVNLSSRYSKMAEWYWRSRNKEKAIAAQEKAIEALKMRAKISESELAIAKELLQKYRSQ